MSVPIKVPEFPESVSEGTVVAWRKQPGEPVRRDEPVVDIETDKVVFEVPAPADGVLAEVLVPEGDSVRAGELIGRLENRAGAAADAGEGEPPGPSRAAAGGEVVATPSARRLIAEHDLDLQAVAGHVGRSRVLKEDVVRFLDERRQQATAPAGADRPQPAAQVTELHPVSQPAAGTEPAPEPVPEPASVPAPGERPERRVPMSRLRARIAERLVEAQHTAAILTTFNEINMQPVMDLRARYREQFQKRHGIKLGFMSFFVKAVIEGLKRFPELNASIDGHEIVYHGYFDIGIAVSSPRGLVVPILRDADQLDMAGIEQGIADFSERAREATLTMEDITGGTFTITNGGVFGSLLSTPILNPPQTGILGMHKIQERPVAEDGQVVIRPMMYVALSYDHRLVDGREAVQFLVTVKEVLEDPARLLLGV